MMTTDCQAKYFAYDLTRRYAPDSAERMAGAVAGAQVDLNPHQVDAALFAFASPLSKGALLACIIHCFLGWALFSEKQFLIALTDLIWPQLLVSGG